MPLPQSLQAFVQQRATRPVTDLAPASTEEERSQYGSWWYRAVACILLSGRVQATNYGPPNRTDVNRVCKEANFNQYLCERVGTCLEAAGVVVQQGIFGHEYIPGPNLDAFWDHDVPRLQEATQAGLGHLVRHFAGDMNQVAGDAVKLHLSDLVTLFFHAFAGLAVREDQLGTILLELSKLPPADLCSTAAELGLDVKESTCAAWSKWLEKDKAQQALLAGIGTLEWAYAEKKNKSEWLYPSAIGLAMLGLGPAPPAEVLPSDLVVQSDLSIFAGTGLPHEKLVPLFRHAKIQHLDRVCTFQINRKRLQVASPDHPPGDELRAALKEVSPLPAAVAELLTVKPVLGGVLEVMGCSAIVKVPTEETRQAIRKHPRLKNYLAPKPPPGYLLIKANADPWNFIDRCRELGFEVRRL
jgi:hypothetical protein